MEKRKTRELRGRPRASTWRAGDVGLISKKRMQLIVHRYGVIAALRLSISSGETPVKQNVRALRDLCDRHGIPIYLDATRLAENAYFIQEREPGFDHWCIAAVRKEFCSCTDGAWMSAKEDHLVNIGGWLAVNDPQVRDLARNLVVVYEGLHTYILLSSWCA